MGGGVLRRTQIDSRDRIPSLVKDVTGHTCHAGYKVGRYEYDYKVDGVPVVIDVCNVTDMDESGLVLDMKKSNTAQLRGYTVIRFQASASNKTIKSVIRQAMNGARVASHTRVLVKEDRAWYTVLWEQVKDLFTWRTS